MSPPTPLTKDVADDLYFPKASGEVLTSKMDSLIEGRKIDSAKLDEILDTFRVVGFVWKNKGKFITAGTVAAIMAVLGYINSLGIF